MVVLRVVVVRVKTILKTEGVISLAGRILSFLVRRVFCYETYYVSDAALDNQAANPADFIPDVANLTFTTFTSNKEADELVANGFEDFRLYHRNARRGLDKGAIAMCLFVGNEVGYLTFIARCEEVVRVFNEMPYRVDFSSRRAYSVGAITVPKHRRKGLKTYGVLLRDETSREMGVATIRAVIRTDNIANLRASALGRRAIARASYVRFLWWKFWKETEVDVLFSEFVEKKDQPI